MKVLKILDEFNSQTTDELQKLLLTRVVKLRKLNKEMKESVAVQKAEDALMAARAPYKKAGARWRSEIEAIELELKRRNIKFNIKQDDIFDDFDNLD